jgi:hypothetical protein
MDPKQRIKEARDLNNNLMRWRVARGLDLEIVKGQKVLVLGMGTLGCGVVRTLMVPEPCCFVPPFFNLMFFLLHIAFATPPGSFHLLL